MWENAVEPGSPQIAEWRNHIACWIPRATHTHTIGLCINYCLSTLTTFVGKGLSVWSCYCSENKQGLFFFTVLTVWCLQRGTNWIHKCNKFYTWSLNGE